MIHFELLLINNGGANSQRLEGVCAHHGVALLNGAESLTATPPGTYVIIGGTPSAVQLKQTCDAILSSGRHVIIVVNALENYDELHDVLGELTERGQIQKTSIDALPDLLKCKHPKVYAFEKSDSTSTIAVLLNCQTWWQRRKVAICHRLRMKGKLGWFGRFMLSMLDDARALVVTRLREPYKDRQTFPGGFLDVFLEDLAGTGSRELLEECRVRIDPRDLILIDVRSDVFRDLRGHIIDHGFAWFVPKHKQEEVLRTAEAGDDAKPGSAVFVSVSLLLTQDLAFDHNALLVRALKYKF